MSKRIRRLIENQTEVKVVAQAYDNNMDKVRFITLATAFAGVFYFFGYYFGSDWWRVLTGG
ncbi:MAG: hypothetical protein U0401_20670 [Anaerolineae bacterium]